MTVTTPDGLQLRVEEMGSGDSALVIPLACWTMPALRPLAEGRRVIAYDPRGRGGSDPVEMSTRFGLEADIADLETVRSALGLERISLLGWSYFGGVVAHYAAAHPARVERIVQIGPIPMRRVPWFGQAAQAVASRIDATAMGELQASTRAGAATRNPEAFCRAWHRALLPAYAVRPDAALTLGAEPCRWPNEHPRRLNALLARLWESLGEWDWQTALGTLEVPMLVIQGDGDFQPREAAAEWAARSGAGLEVIAGAGHLAWVDRPSVVLRLVRDFLGGSVIVKSL